MEMTTPVFWAVAAVALLYSSVGHGGASGYLAVMALLSVPTSLAKPSALLLNLLVAGLSFAHFRAAGHFRLSRLWPFALASIPLSYLGARIDVSPKIYGALLALSLLAAALRLALVTRSDQTPLSPFPSLLWTLPLGAVLGLLSGIVGVGGGIFLSPILILARWADPKETAGVSAAFIWVNSLAGLLGQGPAAMNALPQVLPWALAAGLGGMAGSALGARRLPPPVLRRVLASVLVVAAYKAVLKVWGA